jgi:hypothetical protein
MEKKGLTHASIYETRSVGVYSNAVFAEFLRFKSLSSIHEQGHWFSERHTSCLRQTTNSKFGC